MTGTKYLSELVDSSALQKGTLNIIKAPTGSGKTWKPFCRLQVGGAFKYTSSNSGGARR